MYGLRAIRNRGCGGRCRANEDTHSIPLTFSHDRSTYHFSVLSPGHVAPADLFLWVYEPELHPEFPLVRVDVLQGQLVALIGYVLWLEA